MVGDKHQGPDAGCSTENAPLSDPRLLHASFHMGWIWERRLASSASQTALAEVINGPNQENRESEMVITRVELSEQPGLRFHGKSGIAVAFPPAPEVRWVESVKSPGCNSEAPEGIHCWGFRLCRRPHRA